jgi:hypothetical protein
VILLISLKLLQRLCEYRNKLAYKAICVVAAYFCHQLGVDEDSNLDDLSDDFAELASDLLDSDPLHAFIFKGMENLKKVSRKN